MNKLSLNNNNLSSAINIMSNRAEDIKKFLKNILYKEGIIHFLDFIIKADELGIYGKDIYTYYTNYIGREKHE